MADYVILLLLLTYLFEAKTNGWRFIYLTAVMGVLVYEVFGIFKESLDVTDLLSEDIVLVEEFFKGFDGNSTTIR